MANLAGGPTALAATYFGIERPRPSPAPVSPPDFRLVDSVDSDRVMSGISPIVAANLPVFIENTLSLTITRPPPIDSSKLSVSL